MLHFVLLWLLQLLISALKLVLKLLPPIRRGLLLLHFPNINNNNIRRRHHVRSNNILTIQSLVEKKSWQKTAIWIRPLS